MRHHHLVSLALLAVVAGCTTEVVGPDTLGAPTNLAYQLVPSGDPDAPEGVVLSWEEPADDRVTNYVIYSRGSTSAGWSRRAETTSSTFHDAGTPHLQYYVASQDASGVESDRSNVVTVDIDDRLPAPSGLVSISLDRAVHLSWSANAYNADPDRFDYYRVYSTLYDLDAQLCDTDWFLEGTTVSDDFLMTGLTNGRPLCFKVSAVTRDGTESVASSFRADTPRPDARNVVVDAVQAAVATSGFRFQLPGNTALGHVLAGDRTDIDFKVDRLADGTIQLVPVRSDVSMVLYSPNATDDLTSIDVAPPDNVFTRTPQAVLPGDGYVVRLMADGALHYGAIRITHVGRDYVIFDWAYQTDPGNPELTRTVGAFVP